MADVEAWQCPNCGAEFEPKLDLAGTMVRCPKCDSGFRAPRVKAFPLPAPQVTLRQIYGTVLVALATLLGIWSTFLAATHETTTVTLGAVVGVAALVVGGMGIVAWWEARRSMEK